MTPAVTEGSTFKAGTRGRLALLALVALTALIHVNGLFGPFQFDDHAVVATDSAAQSWAEWGDTLARRIRPLLKASYVATHQLGGWLGHGSLGHHLGSLLIHLAAVMLAWRLALVLIVSFGTPGRLARRAALGCAAVLAVHPLATEAVTYITGRSVALGTMFALAAALAQMEAGRASVSHRRRLALRAAAVAAYPAAVLSRETTLVLPALLVLLEWGRGDAPGIAFGAQRLRVALKRTAVFWGTAGLAATGLFLHGRYRALIELSGIIAQGRLGRPSLLLALEYLASRLVLLGPLSIDPAIQPEDMSLANRIVASLAAATGLLLAWRWRTSRPWWIIGFGWALISLAPVYLVPIRHDGISERHFYPALWGAGFAFSCEIASRLRRGLITVLGSVVILVFSAATVIRNADYSTEIALWDATSQASPDKPRAFNNLGVAFMREHRWAEARAAFERALTLDPAYARARANLERAILREQTGDPFAEPDS